MSDRIQGPPSNHSSVLLQQPRPRGQGLPPYNPGDWTHPRLPVSGTTLQLLMGPDACYAPSNPRVAAGPVELQMRAATTVTGGARNDQAPPPIEASPLEKTLRGVEAFSDVGDLPNAHWRLGGLSRAIPDRVSGVAGRLAPVGLFSESVALFTKDIPNAWNSVPRAFDPGATAEEKNKALADGSEAFSTALSIPANAGQLYLDRLQGAAEKAFREAAPNASPRVVGEASEKAMKQGLQKVELTPKQAKRGVTEAATEAAKKSGSTLAKGAGAPSRAVAKELLEEGGEAAAKAAAKAAGKGALKAGGKALGRLVPGLNVAIAVADGANMVATLRDPKASPGKKAASVVTAFGSGLAATQIPGISQAGAAVSTVSEFIGSFF